ncbi:MAG: protein kinase domain-containing protein [Betaproteobacteria bacterium]
MMLNAGARLGPYEIIGALASGGMGEVYEAEDVRLRRRVAIKFLSADLAGDAAAIDRFRREARAASALDHPHICTVHDIGQVDATGQPFLVMEKLEGQTLEEAIASGPLDESTSVRLGAQLADALEAAHAKGIVHRDLKPANIFVTARGDAKVLDFGVAKAPTPTRNSSTHGTDITDDDRATGPGLAIGTLAYMSPEQARGEPLDTRTDLFSLGVVLYEMATGTPPFKGDTAAVVFDAILNRAPVTPTRLNPKVSPQLEAIINRALEKDRAVRYQTAAEMRADLQRDDRSLGRPRAHHGSGNHAVRVRRASTAAAVGLALAAVTALFLHARQTPALTVRDTILIAGFANATGDPIFDDTLRQALAVKLDESPFLNVFPQGRVAQALRLMGRHPTDRVDAVVAQELCLRQNLKAMVSGSIAAIGSRYLLTLNAVMCTTGDSIARVEAEAPNRDSVLKALGQSASALRARLGESLASIRRFDVPLEEATTSSLDALRAFTLAGAGRGERAIIPLVKQAIELDPDFAMAHMRLATAYRNLGAASLASEETAKAFHLRHRASERERLLITAFHAARVTGDLTAEMDAWKLLQETYPRFSGPFNNLANTYRLHFGDLPRAIEGYRRAIALHQTGNVAAGSYNLANVAIGYYNLTSAFIEAGRLKEARDTVAEAIARKQVYWALPSAQFRIAFAGRDTAGMNAALQALAESDPGRALLPEIVSAQYHGRVRDAETLNRRAIELQGGELSNELRGTALLDLAEFEAAVGRTREAIEQARAALKMLDQRDALARAARIEATAGHVAAAQALLDRAEPLYASTDTIAHAVLLPSIRAQMELARANPAAAVELLKAAVPYRGLLHHDVVYLRATALLASGSCAESLDEFQWLAQQPPGFDAGFGAKGHLYSLSWLGVARAAAATGDIERSRRAYQEFLTIWKNADPDAPILSAAKLEYAKLGARQD